MCKNGRIRPVYKENPEGINPGIRKEEEK